MTPTSPEPKVNQLPPDGGVLAAVVAIVGTLLWLRRKLSSDNKAIAKDRIETDFVLLLQAQLAASHKALDVVYTERNKLAEEVGGLRARVEMLSSENNELRTRLIHLEQRIVTLTSHEA